MDITIRVRKFGTLNSHQDGHIPRKLVDFVDAAQKALSE